MRVLALPARHRLLGRTVCRAQGCRNIVQSGLTVCHRCFTRLTRLGMSRAEIAAAACLPAEPVSATRCAVSGCRCVPTVRHAVLCELHAKKFRLRRPPMSMQQFLADPRVRPLPAMPACSVAACTRPADSARGYCNTHYPCNAFCVASESNVVGGSAPSSISGGMPSCAAATLRTTFARPRTLSTGVATECGNIPRIGGNPASLATPR